MCKLICQLDGIIVVFITLAKVTDSLRTALKKKKKPLIYLIKKMGAAVCTCITAIHTVQRMIITILICINH